MIAIGSGGLFGVGGGKGNLDLVAASDTDLVFGFVAEEWGLIVGLACVAALIIFALYAVKRAAFTYSVYYSIAAAAAAGMFLFQAALNIFGSTDLLPLTGVTLPLISNGGSSMLASMGMLAFIKSAGLGGDAK
ncbi:MAG: FtsW/RodA/SpoVE family cell cycle protein, partial [Acutalibacteraceae bacterium]|nr:FtsW/RodA/SpoVE family cell cycle protein [Acutalibacteraceae bacterium]